MAVKHQSIKCSLKKLQHKRKPFTVKEKHLCLLKWFQYGVNRSPRIDTLWAVSSKLACTTSSFLNGKYSRCYWALSMFHSNNICPQQITEFRPLKWHKMALCKTNASRIFKRYSSNAISPHRRNNSWFFSKSLFLHNPSDHSRESERKLS